MFGIVIEVSAMFVATITFRESLGALRKTFNCSEFGKEPYIGKAINCTENKRINWINYHNES